MYKFFCISGVFLMYYVSAKAQYDIEIGGGYALNHVSCSYAFYNSTSGGSFCLSLMAKKKLGRLYSMKTGIQLIPKSYKIIGEGGLSGTESNFENLYFKVPVILQVVPIKRRNINVVLNTGMYLAHMLSEKESGIIPNIFNSFNDFSPKEGTYQRLLYSRYSETKRIKNLNNRRLEYGLVFGQVFYYMYTERLAFFFESNLYYALTAMQKNSYVNEPIKKNITLGLFLGCVIAIKKDD